MLPLRNKVLVINAGSSSLKFKLFGLNRAAGALGGGLEAASAGSGRSAEAVGSAADSAGSAAAGPASGAKSGLHPIASGLCEKIGDPSGDALMRAAAGSGSWRDGERVAEPMPDHGAALRLVARFLHGAFSQDIEHEVLGVGHRVVHGGTIGESVLIGEASRSALEDASKLAPLHNPPALHCIDAAQRLFGDSPHVAVFDTTFHATMPPEAFSYALPKDLVRKHSLRRYGFHGISYSYLTHEAARMLDKPADQVNLIICHLGAGSSMCAVAGGRSIETSMGLTPLEGLVMGTRCGDLDPAIPLFLQGQGYTAAEVDDLLNKKSGFLGMTGSIDVRSVEDCALAGDEDCLMALAVYLRRLRKYLGAYLVHLGGRVDAVVFSAGIGENGSMLRELALSHLEWAGIRVDPAANDATVRGRSGEVQAPGSRVKVLVIPTDEQLEIAEQTLAVVRRHSGQMAAAA